MRKLMKSETENFDDGTSQLCEWFDDGSLLITDINKNGNAICSYSADDSYYQSFTCGLCHEPFPECSCPDF